MINPQEFTFESIVRKSFVESQTHHGDLGLGFEDYSARIRFIVEKYCRSDFRRTSALHFTSGLYLNDLFLSTACFYHSASAWERFISLYKQSILKWSYFACESRGFSEELAQSILTDLYLPGQSGNSRIASYDGRSSLAAWLQVIVRHRAINEQKRKDNTLLSIDDVPARIDETYFERLNARIRAGQYQSIIRDSFNSAVRGLTHREKFILLLRYEKGLQSAEIARSFGLSPSAMSRQIHGICRKLQEEIVSTLIHTHRLNETALKECIADIMENPAYSILELIKAD